MFYHLKTFIFKINELCEITIFQKIYLNNIFKLTSLRITVIFNLIKAN